MKCHFLRLCAVLLILILKVRSIGRCGCECDYTVIPSSPSIDYIGSVGVNATNSSACTDALCRQVYTSCRKGGGAIPSFSGDFGIFDGHWRMPPSYFNGACNGKCCPYDIVLEDNQIGFNSWAYEGTVAWSGVCYTGTTATVIGRQSSNKKMVVFQLPIGSMVIDYDSSTGRLMATNPDDQTFPLFCHSGNCQNNLNVDTTGTGPASSSATKEGIKFIVVILTSYCLLVGL